MRGRWPARPRPAGGARPPRRLRPLHPPPRRGRCRLCGRWRCPRGARRPADAGLMRRSSSPCGERSVPPAHRGDRGGAGRRAADGGHLVRRGRPHRHFRIGTAAPFMLRSGGRVRAGMFLGAGLDGAPRQVRSSALVLAAVGRFRWRRATQRALARCKTRLVMFRRYGWSSGSGVSVAALAAAAGGATLDLRVHSRGAARRRLVRRRPRGLARSRQRPPRRGGEAPRLRRRLVRGAQRAPRAISVSLHVGRSGRPDKLVDLLLADGRYTLRRETS